MNFKSKFLKEFYQRGFLAQATDLAKLDEVMSQQSIVAYIGFDCTATSLHAGSLIQIMILRLLQKHQHRCIVLLGGGTTKIGDPSGKDEARQVLSNEQILTNLQGIKKNLEKFINFNGSNPALIVNNDQWLADLNYLEFLRDIGRHFSINRMLTFDSVKTRLDREQPLSFLEFNYMILQAYDFVELNRQYQCQLQIGGSDQWGNIVNGTELSRRLNAFQGRTDQVNEVFGLTTPLLTTADGKKMGKSAQGAVWLDENLLSPFDYFQYFRNTHDDDVIKFLKLFTDLDLEKIANFEKLTGQDLNQVKEVLAFETTKICYSEKIAQEVLHQSKEIFLNKNSQAFLEKIIECSDQEIKLSEILLAIKACESKGEAKRLIEGNAVKINNQLICDINLALKVNQEFQLTIGKKKYFTIKIIKN